MAFPVRMGSYGTLLNSVEPPAIDVPYPSGIIAGELLVLGLTRLNAGTVTIDDAGWTIPTNAQFTRISQVHLHAWKIADGTESGNLSLTDSASNNRATRAFIGRFAGYNASDPMEFAASQSFDALTQCNPPALTPTGGTADYLWFTLGTIASFGWDAPPANYSLYQFGTGVSASGHPLWVARELNASTENPGNYDRGGAASSAAVTFCIKPGSAGLGSSARNYGYIID
jgi:hypothetical protein